MDLGFTPGRYSHVESLPQDAVLTLVKQVHNARKAHKHRDLRIGGPSGMLSWALPKDLPEVPGEKRLAIRTPDHTWAYSTGFEGTIPEGQYGAGTVQKEEQSPVVILKNSPDHLVFTRGNSKDATVYSMHRTRNDNWIVTIKKPDEPLAVRSYKKQHFQSIPMDQVADLIDQGASVSAKIDGAGVIAWLSNKGIDVYGIRPNAEGKHPRYTEYISGTLNSAKVPEELQNKLIRGEVYGMQGKRVIHPSELTAILNSNLATAIDKKQKGGIRLLVAALAENRDGRDDYTVDTMALADKLNNPYIHGMPLITGTAAKRLVKQIAAGKYPLTREGVVIHRTGKPTLKAKNTSDYDAIIRDIFKADTDRGDMAGGFYYSYPDSDEITGKTGTGFTLAQRKDMWEHPENWIGQTVRLKSQERLPSGVLRSPSFIALKAD